MKNKTLFIAISLCGVLCAPIVGFGAEKKATAAAAPAASPAASAAASPAAKPMRPIPFHGMIASVDHKANTFTIAGKEKSRVFKVTDKTQITKGGAAATHKDIAENQEVSGSYWKSADGSLEAKTVKLGPVKAAAAAKTDKAEAKASPSASPKKP
jgi:poly(3-hydroxybutyrate) depolymerase